MKLFLCLVLVAVSLAIADELPLAEPCDPEICQLPDCRCSGTDIPGGLEPRNTPQFVAVTFGDAINVLNIQTYRRTLYDRTNWNGCQASATFYISHEYTNYQLVNELYNEGFEIGLNSITRRVPQTYWAQATKDDMAREFGDQKMQISYFGRVLLSEIKGIRVPFFQTGGNASFAMMKDFGLVYDETWGSFAQTNPALWPYTLDYESTQDCSVPPCPTASIPGIWVKPMISWFDLSNFPCIVMEACYHLPDWNDENAWFNFIVQNFERHYFGNRAPFSLNTHEWVMSFYPAVERAVVRFLDMINSLQDVYMVRSSDVIDWVKNPVPINEYNEFLQNGGCRIVPQTNCPAFDCGPLLSEHSEQAFWMGSCTLCPRVYPWLGNPLGL